MPRVNLKMISGKRGAVRDRRGMTGGFVVTAVMLVVFTLILNALYGAAEPMVAELAAAGAREQISDRIEECVSGADLSGLTALTYSSSGVVSGVVCDVARINEVRSSLAREISRSLSDSPVRIPIRIGDIAGGAITSGRGPSIIVRTTGYSVTSLDIDSEIENAGINQSLYKLRLTVSVKCSMILPRRRTKETEVTSTFPLCETLIVGEVPSYYGNH